MWRFISLCLLAITKVFFKAAVSKEHGVPVEAISIENINITAGSKLGVNIHNVLF